MAKMRLKLFIKKNNKMTDQIVMLKDDTKK